MSLYSTIDVHGVSAFVMVVDFLLNRVIIRGKQWILAIIPMLLYMPVSPIVIVDIAYYISNGISLIPYVRPR